MQSDKLPIPLIIRPILHDLGAIPAHAAMARIVLNKIETFYFVLYRPSNKRETVMNKPSKLVAISSAVLSTFALTAAHAQQAAPPAPEHTLATKVSLYSEYEYRGISQTSEKPAVQLNLDYSHTSGFYLGAFLSNISWIKDTKSAVQQGLPPSTIAVPVSLSGSAGGVELDLFGGYKFEIVKDITLDVGYLRYEYIGSDALNVRIGNTTAVALAKPSTNEVYVGIAGGPFSAKYSYSTGDTFGAVNSKGSTFTEFNWSQEVLPKFTMNAQIAKQTFKNNSPLTYTVYKLGGTYDFGSGWNAGAYYKATNAIKASYTYLHHDWSENRLVAFVSKSF